MSSTTISSTNTSPIFNDNTILVLESTNDTFSTKRIYLTDNVPVKIGRMANKNTHQTQTNGYFDSRVLSRTHAEIWSDNGKVFIRDLKSSNGTFVNGKRISLEDKESDPVELKTYDALEFGIDIFNEQDRKLMFRKIAATVQIISSNNARSRLSVIKNGQSSCKRRPGLTPGVYSHDGSIYASLEFELHNARDESRRLIELNNVLNDIGNTLEGRSNRERLDENVVVQNFKEAQTKFQAHILNYDLEKDAVMSELNRKLEHAIYLRNEYQEKSQMYEKKIQQLEENLKSTWSQNPESDSKQIEELKVQVQRLSQQLEYSQKQLKDANIIHSGEEDDLQKQLNELVSQLKSSRLLHASEVDELKYKIQEMNIQLENTNRELGDLQDLHSSNAEKYKNRIDELLKQLDCAQNDVLNDTIKIDEQLNVLSDFNELKSKYEQTIIEHEASISKLNEEHIDVITFKDNLISCLQREKEDISNQFTDFKKVSQNTLDTIEKIISTLNENSNLTIANGEYLKKIDILRTCLKNCTGANCSEIEQIRTENEIQSEGNFKIKPELKRLNQEESVEIDRNVKAELSKCLNGESSQAAVYRKPRTLVKDSERTKEKDSPILMEDFFTVLVISFTSLTFITYLFESSIFNVIFIGFGTYILLNLS